MFPFFLVKSKASQYWLHYISHHTCLLFLNVIINMNLLKAPNILKPVLHLQHEPYFVHLTKGFMEWYAIQPWKWKAKDWSSVMSDSAPMEYSLPGSSVHGIFQAGILEWVAILFSRGSCQWVCHQEVPVVKKNQLDFILEKVPVRLVWLAQTHQHWQGFPSDSAVRNILFLDQEDPLEKEMANHSSVLAWEIPWTEEPGGLQSMGSQKS